MARIPRRFAYLAHWLRAAVRGQPRPTSFVEMLRFAAQPPYRVRGQRHIARVAPHDGMLAVHFHGLAQPLFWPAELPLDALRMVASEQFDRDDWHQYEVEETRVLPEDVVVDCGAAEGLFALRVATRCRRVHAIEPFPRFVQSMRRTLHGFPNVTIHECLLGDRDGPARLGGEGLTAMESARGIEVPVRTLDSLFPAGGEDPTYLKADVEGAELRVLAGARALIRRRGPRIAFTTYHAPGHAADIAALLREIEPRYRIRTKGWSQFGTPLLLHAWVEGPR